MRSIVWLSLIVPVMGSAGCVMGRYTASPYGRHVEVVPVPDSAHTRVSGELIAVNPDSIWVLADQGLMTVPLVQVDAVRVVRHGFTPGKVLLRSAVAGVLSGIALSAACSSVEDANCAGVFPAVLFSWGIVGGLSAATVSSQLRLRALDWQQLRLYARFPQGIPEQFPRTP